MTGVATLPIDAWRKGDFSTLFNAQGAQVGLGSAGVRLRRRADQNKV